MTKFSLIVPTVGRISELRRMLQSVGNQDSADVEIIIVDQNDDARVATLLSELPLALPVRHLRMDRKSLSGARNLGLTHATGEIVAFPDDDCWYPNGLLCDVERWFGEHPAYQILAVGAVDESGLQSGNRWFQSECDIRPINALRTTFSNTLFLKRDALPMEIRFDESLSASEETDYILRLLKTGLKGRFDRRITVGHPRRDMLSGTVTTDRARKYGRGMGQFVRHHSLALLWVSLLGYDLLRAGSVLCRGRLDDAQFCLAHARGLFWGFLGAR